MSERKDAAPGAAEAEDREDQEAAPEDGDGQPQEPQETAGAGPREEGAAAAEPQEAQAQDPGAQDAKADTEADTVPAAEPEAEPEAEETPAPEPGPEERLAAAEVEIAELKDRLLRAMAETENVRRRAERDRAETAKYGIASFARDLLSVADNLRRAISIVPEDGRDGDETLASLVEGVKVTERELLGVLERYGIRPIDPMGEKFDHNWHQAVMQLDEPSSPPGTVVQVMQIGYAIQDRLLRPAMVAVAKGEKKGDEEGQSVDTTV
ncbi:MAG: nucleotide exchange factor GrpE [Alphaproteobacteria bacterium]|nr:nucleotide exchange factor GrpE [Alphaproteobacteria bacterium]